MRLYLAPAIAATAVLAFAGLAHGQTEDTARDGAALAVVTRLAASHACMRDYNERALVENRPLAQERISNLAGETTYTWGTPQKPSAPECGSVSLFAEPTVKGMFSQAMFLQGMGRLKSSLNQLAQPMQRPVADRKSDTISFTPRQLRGLAAKFSANVLKTLPGETSLTTSAPHQLIPAGDAPYNAGYVLARPSPIMAMH